MFALKKKRSAVDHKKGAFNVETKEASLALLRVMP